MTLTSIERPLRGESIWPARPFAEFPHEDWRGAACREAGADPALFDPVQEGERFRHYPVRAVAAARYCRRCPLFDLCKARADARREQGVWAGTFRTGSYISDYRAMPIPEQIPHRKTR